MLYDNELYDYELLKITEEVFDESYYLSEYPDVIAAPISAFEHYLNFGWKEGRNPNSDFNTYDYLEFNEDVAKANINPLYHYVVWGRFEGRLIKKPEPSISSGNEVYEYLQQVHVDGNRSPDFAPKLDMDVNKNDNAPKIIAFYLPQFHPFKENNEWWGEGFTEWSNVAKAIPQFKGHYQPRLPADLGYYDLRVPEVMAAQIDMAKQYGVEGFCFHYYWFAGHRLMERPIEEYLDNENLNFPFCLCWANENWSRRWDGSENDILIAQEHSKEDNQNVFYDLLRYFKDDRYIKVDGKPLIVIYRPDIIPNLKELVFQWRELALKEGLVGLQLVCTNAFGFHDFQSIGFDAIVEFPPHNVQAGSINSSLELYNVNYSGLAYNYSDVVDFSLRRLDDKNNRNDCKSYYPTVMTNWDNSARKPGRGNVFLGASPNEFYRWLKGCYEWSSKNHESNNKFLFVNAWNEWAEGTYLEPDKKYGYSYLNVVRTTINEANRENRVRKLSEIASLEGAKNSKILIMVHVFYPDLVEEIMESIAQIELLFDVDIAISVSDNILPDQLTKIVSRMNPIYIEVCENRGRDIWPFLKLLDKVKTYGYEFGLKLHTKKSTHLTNGSEWRRSIYSGLMNKSAVKNVISNMESNDLLGIAAPKESFYQLKDDYLVNNVESIARLKEIYALNDLHGGDVFVGGTMFWFRFDAILKLLNENVDSNLFGPELGAIDGTIAHAYERLITKILSESGYELFQYEGQDVINPY